MHSEMRRVPAERARHAKRLGHVGKLLAGASGSSTSATTSQQSAPAASVSASSGQSVATTASAKQSSSSAVPSSSPTQASSSASSSATSARTSSVAPSSTPSLGPVTASSSSFVLQPVTLTPSSVTSSSTSTAHSAAAVTNSGLSGGAIAGIIAASVIVGIALIVFFVRKTYLRRREHKRISWNGASGLGAGILDEPKPIPDVSERSASFVSASNNSQRRPSLFPFEAHGNYMYSTPPVGPMQHPATPTYATPAPPLASYNNPAYPVPYNPGNSAALAMARVPAGTGISSALTSVTARCAPMEAVVNCTFVPSLPDELPITTGERVFVVEQYDDGWNLCFNGRGERGMVPRECLEYAPSDQPDISWRNVRRSSSLNPDGKRF